MSEIHTCSRADIVDRDMDQFLDQSSVHSSDMSSTYEPPKKKRIRAKLDHLTPGEKLQRRKMKNRIAAQTARDRKRAKIDHLEEENRKLRQENKLLKSQLKMTIPPNANLPSSHMVDSGISENDSTLKTSASASMADSIEMDLLAVPQQSNCPSPSGSSTSGAYTASPIPEVNNYLDSVVGVTDENMLINDILQLQDSLFSAHGNETSIESAELINEPQQQVQEVLSQSLSVENSAGWTSIQLMLLLLISKVHRMYSSRINCCAMNPETVQDTTPECCNLFDYIHQVRCGDLKRAAEAIISKKNDIRQQKLIALEFVYIYLYNNKFRRPTLIGHA